MDSGTRYPIKVIVNDLAGGQSEEEIGEFYLTTFPGCCKIAVSHGLKIKTEYRNYGFGTQAQEERLKLAKSLGYKVILATVVDTNKAQEKILTRAGWRRTTFYESPSKGYNVELWQKNLDDPYEEAQGTGKGCR